MGKKIFLTRGIFLFLKIYERGRQRGRACDLAILYLISLILAPVAFMDLNKRTRKEVRHRDSDLKRAERQDEIRITMSDPFMTPLLELNEAITYFSQHLRNSQKKLEFEEMRKILRMLIQIFK